MCPRTPHAACHERCTWREASHGQSNYPLNPPQAARAPLPCTLLHVSAKRSMCAVLTCVLCLTAGAWSCWLQLSNAYGSQIALVVYVYSCSVRPSVRHLCPVMVFFSVCLSLVVFCSSSEAGVCVTARSMERPWSWLSGMPRFVV